MCVRMLSEFLTEVIPPTFSLYSHIRMVENGFENHFQSRCSGAITVPLMNSSYLEGNLFKNIFIRCSIQLPATLVQIQKLR